MKKNTCEVSYYRYMFNIYMIVNVVFVSMFGVHTIVIRSDISECIYQLIVWIILIIPMTIYNGYRLWYYKKLILSNVQELILEKVESKWARRSCFVFTMNIDGEERIVRSLSIFNIGSFGPNLIDNYVGKKALVGYDAKNDVAVIIKKITV